MAYRDISASEAASRLELHIKTAQEFLEGLFEQEIVAREEVSEGKRPYYRYQLQKKRFCIEVDLSDFYVAGKEEKKLSARIREKKNATALFAMGRDNASISTLTILSEQGRERKGKKINLTAAQGKFLFHLPFPTAEVLSLEEIMEKAGVGREYAAEILSLTDLLIAHAIIFCEA